jgi:arabinose-5-phosphate isomerase
MNHSKFTLHPDQIKKRAKAVIHTEADVIRTLCSRVNDSFVSACKILLNCAGHVILTGIGKSGHIARKIAATFASTGTPAFFVHPGEANHGDIGMLTEKDVILALSNSGETPELLSLLPLISHTKISLIAMTGNRESTLADYAAVNLDISIDQEACSLGVVPTCSTTAMLVMGDAVAVALLESRGFTKNDFARFHPGGYLGRRLLLRVKDIMHTGKKIPKVNEKDALSKVFN